MAEGWIFFYSSPGNFSLILISATYDELATKHAQFLYISWTARRSTQKKHNGYKYTAQPYGFANAAKLRCIWQHSFVLIHMRIAGTGIVQGRPLAVYFQPPYLPGSHALHFGNLADNTASFCFIEVYPDDVVLICPFCI